MSSCPTYPATTVGQAADLLVDDANRMHQLVHGGVDTVVETCEGNGDIPSWARALNQRATYKTPLDWANGTTETDLTQPRTFDDQIYVPLRTPTTMGVSPGDDWSLYSYTNIFSTEVESFSDALAGDFTNVNRVVVQSYSHTQNPGKGGFVGVKNGSTGSSGTGNCMRWRDNAGNEFILPPDINPDLYMFGVNDDGSDQTTAIETALTALTNDNVHNTIIVPVPNTTWGIDDLTIPNGVKIVGLDMEASLFENLNLGGDAMTTTGDNVGLFNFTINSVGGGGGIFTGSASNDCRIDRVRVLSGTNDGFRIRGSGHRIGYIEALNAPLDLSNGVRLDGEDISVDTMVLVDSKMRVQGTSTSIQTIDSRGQPTAGPICGFIDSDNTTIGNIISNGLQPNNANFYLLDVVGDYLDIQNIDIIVDDWDESASIIDGPPGRGCSIGRLNIRIEGGTADFESDPIMDFSGIALNASFSIGSVYVEDGSATSASEGTRFLDVSTGTDFKVSHFDGNKFVESNAARVGTNRLLPNSMAYEVDLTSDVLTPLSALTPLFVGQKCYRVPTTPATDAYYEVYRAYGVTAGDWNREIPAPHIRLQGETTGNTLLATSVYTLTVDAAGDSAGGADGRTFDTWQNAIERMPVGLPCEIAFNTGFEIDADLLIGAGRYLIISGGSNTLTFTSLSEITIAPGGTLEIHINVDMEGHSTSPFRASGGTLIFRDCDVSVDDGSDTSLIAASAIRGGTSNIAFDSSCSFANRDTSAEIINSLDSDARWLVGYGTTNIGTNWIETGNQLS